VSEGSVGEAVEARTESDAALAAYRARMRRPRLVYAAVLAALVLVVGLLVGVAWTHGEITHVHQKTAAGPPPSLPLSTPAATLSRTWTSTDRTAIGTPVWGGTVVSYDTHAVRGRDARTGAVRWSYTRTDRVLCDAIQSQGLTFALYEVNGNCDELTALSTDTGARSWVRTLDESGYPIFGKPVIAVSDVSLMFTTPSVIYNLDPVRANDHFQYSQPGCRINSAVLGSAGVLISQTCTNPNCSSQTYCHTGPQLLLRDGTNSRNDSDSKNPDRITWERANDSDIPVSADGVISSVSANGASLSILDVTKGSTTSTLSLHSDGGIAPIQQAATARAEVIQVGGYTYSVEETGADFFWSRQGSPMPTITAQGGNPSISPDLSTAIVAATTPDAVELLDGGTGKVARTITCGPLPAGSLAYPMGSGFLIAGTSTSSYS
jgi:hypothetical protein